MISLSIHQVVIVRFLFCLALYVIVMMVGGRAYDWLERDTESEAG